uniref:Uncharacterized protein n=1 Tax=Arundo donax TaxID=35708 RepID=A0A0A8ZLA0_ARUDO
MHSQSYVDCGCCGVNWRSL